MKRTPKTDVKPAFRQPVYSQLLISKYNHFFAQSKINLQKKFSGYFMGCCGSIFGGGATPRQQKQR